VPIPRTHASATGVLPLVQVFVPPLVPQDNHHQGVELFVPPLVPQAAGDHGNL